MEWGLTYHCFKIKLKFRTTSLDLMRDPQYNGVSNLNRYHGSLASNPLPPRDLEEQLMVTTSFFLDATSCTKLARTLHNYVAPRHRPYAMLFLLESFYRRGSRVLPLQGRKIPTQLIFCTSYLPQGS